MMNEKGWRIGGENSGHIICLDQTTTGMVSSPPAGADGHAQCRDAAGQIAFGHEQVPASAGQCALRRRQDPLTSSAVQQEVAAVEQELAGRGRCCCANPAPNP